MVEPVFQNIQSAIQKELLKARISIKAAVAWFTQEITYRILIEKLEDGVIVELILNDDDINHKSANHLDFEEFVQKGGLLHWASGKLMHTKFCIVDGKVLLEGSANWTYGSNHNSESENIYRDEPTIVAEYETMFGDLVNKYPAVVRTIASNQKIKSQLLVTKSKLSGLSLSQQQQVETIIKKWKK